jgi:hypothetical protein
MLSRAVLAGDEEDGFDDTIVPVDYQQTGQIRDDLLFERLVMPLPEGSQLTAVMDCCHSGTVLDLPYMIQVRHTAPIYSTITTIPEFPSLKCCSLCVFLAPPLSPSYPSSPSHLQASSSDDLENATMVENPGFNFTQLIKIGQKLFAAKNAGASNQELASMAAKDLMPMMKDLAKKNKEAGGKGGGSMASIFAMLADQ